MLKERRLIDMPHGVSHYSMERFAVCVAVVSDSEIVRDIMQ